MSIFINRFRELALLEERYGSDRAELVVIYGRRRVGKSELIDRFIAASGGIRLLAREESKALQLRRFTADLAEYFNDPVLARTTFTDWDGFFEYLASRSLERIVIAIDEFPYLVKEDPSLPSLLQAAWDRVLSRGKIFFILSGSSISLVESSLMRYTSPLHGRRTGQMLLRPLRFRDLLEYIPEIGPAVETYAVFGGTPAYLIAADPSRTALENAERAILREDAFLYRDVEFVLRSELSEPRYYFAILLSIARGNHRLGLIANDTGLSAGLVNKYLSVLIDLQLVQREVPATESEKSRAGLYILADNLFDFWFRFVYPNLELIERGDARLLLERHIRPQFAQYVGPHFEEAVQDLLLCANTGGALPFTFLSLGRWWHRGDEIDLVATDPPGRTIGFCECRWRDGVDGGEVLQKLREKAARMPWHRGNRVEHYWIAARSFSRRPEGERVIGFDLGDLEQLWRRCHAGNHSGIADTLE